MINLSARLKSIKAAQVHHGTGCSVYSGILWTPLLHAIPKKKKTLQAWTRSLLAVDDNVTVIERRLIHVPPFFYFFYFFLNTPERRKTDAVRGARASVLLTRPICVLGKNVLTGTCKGGKNSLSQQRFALKIKWQCARACVKWERYDLSLLCQHICVLCLSAILKWYLFFQIRSVEPLLSPPVNSVFKIIK